MTRLEEFREQRFGMFVHWGLYALPARHEWVKNRERLTDEQYQVYLEHFDPDLFDPEAWAEAAAGAGMRYLVLTTKHHDGFCLWDSGLTDYSVAGTPYGRDLVGPIAAAFRAAGLGVGFYHSLIDWHHPHFPLDELHPSYGRDTGGDRDIGIYRKYLHGQVEELLTRYAPVDTMWFDFSYPTRFPGGKGREDWGSEELVELVRRLSPDTLINDRLDVPGDFVTPEQYQPAGPVTVGGRPVVWEACQTLNGSWGYDRDNHDVKSVDLLVRMLVDTVAKDGNLLLNVGPNGRGELDPGALETLRGIGAWMRLHGRSIYGAGPSEHTPPPDCRYTRRGDRLYVHIFAWPFDHLHLPGLAGRVRYAQFLHDASEVPRLEPSDRVPPGTLTLKVPVRRPAVAVPVIELFLDQEKPDQEKS
ncbi:alpha-L-fucosidase [Thermocatellispora tengchongensis]|uniref:alpha-L-fucosidase n=1 Tax=Thermocatellispora tengchongensis TaxID=1073253 RepID=A0A840PJG0_9ACTN|nr:alpha-L-fucosidase [Thermocatellispora tengchongensis]MBB5137951.1 alpha-L-fucosidase [Thermocatellispora tengchongensis]